MAESEKTRKIVVLATGAAVALSATTIALVNQIATPSGATTATQVALQQGANNAKATGNASGWLHLASCQGATACD